MPLHPEPAALPVNLGRPVPAAGAPLHHPWRIALQAERLETDGRAGRLSYYVAGQGPPLLLIHGLHAAASAFETRPIFELAQATHRVYAVDLPGFGFSDRSDRHYRVALYVAAVDDMLDVIARRSGCVPVDALALGLGSEFLARAATLTPDRFRTLALVAPTGFSRGAASPGAPVGATRETPGLQRLLGLVPWRRALFGLMASAPGIRHGLQRAWGSRQIDADLYDYARITARQPGAHHAPSALVSGRLHSRDALRVYRALRLPVWLAHGQRGRGCDLSELDTVARRANWTVKAFDTGNMPHFERQVNFSRAYERFLAQPHAGGGSVTGSIAPVPTLARLPSRCA